jgi:hypothetical protein
MDKDEVPREESHPNAAVAQGQGKEKPVQWVGCSGLGLADEGLAAPVVWVPQRCASRVNLARLELEPWEHLPRDIRAVEPGVLPGERQLPIEEDCNDKEQGSRGSGSARATGPVWPFLIGLVVFGHWHNVSIIPDFHAIQALPGLV